MGSELVWRREAGGDWVLLKKRRRMGRVVPDGRYCGMYRIALSRGRMSGMANLSWAKSLALDAAERELAYELACNRVAESQAKGGVI